MRKNFFSHKKGSVKNKSHTIDMANKKIEKLTDKFEEMSEKILKLEKRLKKNEKKCLGKAEENGKDEEVMEKKKRDPSEFNLFVKEFVNSMPADTPQERLALCAKAYAEFKETGKKPKKSKK